jgi:peptidoglycan/LPS O-acetylase OafA/YrhL
MNTAFFQKGLTGFRALAALWVTVFHLNSTVGERQIYVHAGNAALNITPLITIGWVGVDLFFVLSAFLLTTHLLERYAPGREREVFASYFKARALRIFPAYWTQIFILFAIAFIAAGTIPAWWTDLPVHMFMLHDLLRPQSFAINGVYWTLPIEFGFYICLPLAIKLIAGRARTDTRVALQRAAWLALACVAFSWAYRLVMFHVYSASGVGALVWVTGQLPGTIDVFAMGMLAAVAYRAASERILLQPPGRRDLISTLSLAAGFAGLVGMMYFLDYVYLDYWSGHWLLIVWHGVTAFFVALIIVSIAISGRLTRWLFENPVTVFLGTISYSIYLWHLPLIDWMAPLIKPPRVGLVVFALAALPIIIAVSALSYYAVERPFLRRKAKLVGEDVSQPGAPGR